MKNKDKQIIIDDPFFEEDIEKRKKAVAKWYDRIFSSYIKMNKGRYNENKV